MSLPVVGSDLGGMSEIVKNRETGLLFPAGDVNALTQKLTILMGDSALRDRMGEAGRARVLEHHRIERVVARYAEILVER